VADIEFRARSFDNGDALLPDQLINYYKQMLNYVVEQLSGELILDDLISIVIPENYKQELFEFQKQNNIPVGYTEDDMAIGHAMALTVKRNNESKKIIFVSKLIIFALVDENVLNELAEDIQKQIVGQRQFAINLIHHELAHVQEFTLLKGNFSMGKIDNTDILTKNLRQLSRTVWTEYYACRVSCMTCPNIVGDIDNLVEQTKEFEEQIVDEIGKYRYHGDINKIVKILHGKLKILLNYSAYLHGKLFSLEESRADYISKINDLLSDFFIHDTWVNIGDKLNNLYTTFPDWCDSSVFDELGQSITLLINRLGFYPEMRDEGVYYSIPFET